MTHLEKPLTERLADLELIVSLLVERYDKNIETFLDVMKDSLLKQNEEILLKSIEEEEQEEENQEEENQEEDSFCSDPRIGSNVIYVQYAPNGRSIIHLPAIVTSVWSGKKVNIQVFTDGPNSDIKMGGTYLKLKWLSYIPFDDSKIVANTWHWHSDTNYLG